MKQNRELTGSALMLALGMVVLHSSVFAASPPPLPTLLPSVEILATDPTALKGTSTAAFTLVREGSTNEPLAINLVISGTAAQGVDYLQIPNPAIIPAGFLAVDLDIQPEAVTPTRGNKTVILTLQTNKTVYRLGSHKQATVTIVDDTMDNLPPKVSLVRPNYGEIFTLPANITLEAAASDPDDAIQYVSFYADDHFLGKVVSSPYTFTWQRVPPGKYALFARAVDELGKSTLSVPVNITVTNVAPAVKLTSPENEAKFKAPATITIKADASDPDGTIKRVSFWANNSYLGQVTHSPYTFTWKNVKAGTYTLKARATDNYDLQTTSATVQVTVTK